MPIPDNLKRLREERRLSQPRLAELAGVTQQLISQLERGENLTTRKLPQIARALGVQAHEIDESYSFDPAAGTHPVGAAGLLGQRRRAHLVRTPRPTPRTRRSSWSRGSTPMATGSRSGSTAIP